MPNALIMPSGVGDPRFMSFLRQIRDKMTELDSTVTTNVTALTGRVDDLEAVTDKVAPAFAETGHTTSTDGESIELHLVETYDLSGTPLVADFTVTVGGSAVTPSAVSLNATNKKIVITLSTADAVVNGNTVTVAYADSAAGSDTNNIVDEAGNKLPNTATALPITNAVPTAG